MFFIYLHIPLLFTIFVDFFMFWSGIICEGVYMGRVSLAGRIAHDVARKGGAGRGVRRKEGHLIPLGRREFEGFYIRRRKIKRCIPLDQVSVLFSG